MSEKNLEIVQDLTFQRRQWRWERIGWVFIALILIAGLAGLFGHQPLARSTNQTQNGQLIIDYDGYGRYDSSAQIIIRAIPDPGGDGRIYLWFDAGYLDSITINAVSPWPLRGEAREGERAFVFQTDGSPFSASLSIQFHTIGIVHGRVRVNEQEALSLIHMVWP